MWLPNLFSHQFLQRLDLPIFPRCHVAALFIRYFFSAIAARSASASRRLNFASSITPWANITIVSLLYEKQSEQDREGGEAHTSIRIAREIPRPRHKRTILSLARSDRVAPDCGHDARVREGWLGGDDRVGYEVVNCLIVTTRIS